MYKLIKMDTVKRPAAALGATVLNRPAVALGATVFKPRYPMSPAAPPQGEVTVTEQTPSLLGGWNPFPANAGFGLQPSIYSELKKKLLDINKIVVEDSMTYEYNEPQNIFIITKVDGKPMSPPILITPDERLTPDERFIAGRKKRSTKRKVNKKKNKKTHSRKYKYKYK